MGKKKQLADDDLGGRPAQHDRPLPQLSQFGSARSVPVQWVRNVHAPCYRKAHNFPTSPRSEWPHHRKPTDETEPCGT